MEMLLNAESVQQTFKRLKNDILCIDGLPASEAWGLAAVQACSQATDWLRKELEICGVMDLPLRRATSVSDELIQTIDGISIASEMTDQERSDFLPTIWTSLVIAECVHETSWDRDPGSSPEQVLASHLSVATWQTSDHPPRLLSSSLQPSAFNANLFCEMAVSCVERYHKEIRDLQADAHVSYRPAKWFTQRTDVPAERLRQTKRRPHQQLRTKTLGTTMILYCVEDALQLWPADMESVAKEFAKRDKA